MTISNQVLYCIYGNLALPLALTNFALRIFTDSSNVQPLDMLFIALPQKLTWLALVTVFDETAAAIVFEKLKHSLLFGHAWRLIRAVRSFSVFDTQSFEHISHSNRAVKLRLLTSHSLLGIYIFFA